MLERRLSKLIHDNKLEQINIQGPVVHSIVSLMSSLRGQLVRCSFTTSLPNTLIYFDEKMIEAFAVLTFFQQKILLNSRY